MTEIQKTEAEIGELIMKLNKLRKDAPRTEVKNYEFETLNGKVSLQQLFGNKNQLMAIHNMGQGCRYCTLWADGINGFLPHLENAMSVVLLSKDSPQVQQTFAHSRQWRYRMASHGGGVYLKEQSVGEPGANYPGVVVYEKEGNKIFKKNSAVFGPGDLFCSIWHFLALAGMGEEGEGAWTPQYSYWKRPEKLDDGGQNVI